MPVYMYMRHGLTFTVTNGARRWSSMNQNHLSQIYVKGYKSMEECNVELRNLNVLIGPNGGGKSAFIEFFNLVNHLFDGRLQEYVAEHGGPDDLLRFGRNVTSQMEMRLVFGARWYSCVLRATDDGRMVFADETVNNEDFGVVSIGSGHFETRIREYDDDIPEVDCQVFHFNEVAPKSPIRLPQSIYLNKKLLADGRNLAPYLYNLKKKYNQDYIRVVKRLRIVAPFFQEFYLKPEEENPEAIRLRWLEHGCNEPLSANLLSDGVLRFACIMSVFRYPKDRRTDIVLMDEPDLGLHPQALELLYHMIHVVSKYSQTLISTQSTEMLDKFDAEDILVVDRKGGKTSLDRLDADELEEWLTNKRQPPITHFLSV
jgi:predicted ATPase